MKLSKTAMLPLVKEFRWREIQKGLDENPQLLSFRDKRGRNWVHVCCGVDVRGLSQSAVRSSIELARLLLERGLGIDDPAFTEENFKATPLWYTIAWGRNLELATYLLKRGCDPNHCLFAASWNNDIAALKLLIRNGAPLESEAEDSTPLLGAIQWSRFAAAEELLKSGANPNYQNSKGMTALHYMLKKDSDKKHFRMLLRYGARVDIPNKEGITAAQIMMRKKDPEFPQMAEKASSAYTLAKSHS
jgi:ankyrin repeat protein